MDYQWVALENTGDRELLRALTLVGLPVSDLGGIGQRYFAFRDRAGAPVAFGGWEEIDADTVLLRSIIVPKEMRGLGLGRRVVEGLMAGAAALGKQRYYLLTMDSAAFFAHLGFRPMERSEAPAALKETAQFRSLCPASATLMRYP